jgi:hypothetical protein
MACLSGHLSQCGSGEGYKAVGGWKFGNTIHGAQAEYLLVPNAQANMARIPPDLSDEQVVLLADIASTGFSGAESGGVRMGDCELRVLSPVRQPRTGVLESVRLDLVPARHRLDHQREPLGRGEHLVVRRGHRYSSSPKRRSHALQ